MSILNLHFDGLRFRCEKDDVPERGKRPGVVVASTSASPVQITDGGNVRLDQYQYHHTIDFCFTLVVLFKQRLLGLIILGSYSFRKSPIYRTTGQVRSFAEESQGRLPVEGDVLLQVTLLSVKGSRGTVITVFHERIQLSFRERDTEEKRRTRKETSLYYIYSNKRKHV